LTVAGVPWRLIMVKSSTEGLYELEVEGSEIAD
jgi:hypothetical protein